MNDGLGRSGRDLSQYLSGGTKENNEKLQSERPASGSRIYHGTSQILKWIANHSTGKFIVRTPYEMKFTLH